MPNDELWNPKTTSFLRKAQEWLEELKYVAVRLSPAQAAKVDLTGLVNEALLKAWRCRKTCLATTPVGVRAWVVMIYVRLIHDQLRRKYTQVEVEAANEFAVRAVCAERSLDPANSASQKETHKMIQDALAELPERHRAILTLHYIEGTPLTHIGELLGMSDAAIKQAAKRARDALKKLLAGVNADHGVGGSDDE